MPIPSSNNVAYERYTSIHCGPDTHGHDNDGSAPCLQYHMYAAQAKAARGGIDFGRARTGALASLSHAGWR